MRTDAVRWKVNLCGLPSRRGTQTCSTCEVSWAERHSGEGLRRPTVQQRDTGSLWSSHTSDFNTASLVATLPGAWRYRSALFFFFFVFFFSSSFFFFLSFSLRLRLRLLLLSLSSCSCCSSSPSSSWPVCMRTDAVGWKVNLSGLPSRHENQTCSTCAFSCADQDALHRGVDVYDI